MKEMILFVKVNKAYWLTPIIIVMILIAAIMAIGTFGGGAAAPFIYTLF